jgi:hypothetical protein
MNAKHSNQDSPIGLLDAVETLSLISDMDFEKEVGVAETHDLELQDKKISYQTIHWLHRKDADATISIIKDVFKVILNYLKDYYNQKLPPPKEEHTLEGIKTIMVLVGEAAKKLDKYTALFHKTKANSVTNLREYKQLQEYYFSRVTKKIEDGMLSKWLFALTQRGWARKEDFETVTETPAETKHVFVDLDGVKRDADYELFFIRKEDGTRFFNPKLIRNIKLVCNFGDYFDTGKQTEDPLVDMSIWNDKAYNNCARNILKQMGNKIPRFYHEAFRHKDRELVEMLNKACLALMLAANTENLKKFPATKSCTEYFKDFLAFLREAVHSMDYVKMITYPQKTGGKLSQLLLNMTQSLCMNLMEQQRYYSDHAFHLHNLIDKATENRSQEHKKVAESNKRIWSYLGSDYAALHKYMKAHAYGPLTKVLRVVEESGRFSYDPLIQENLPSQQYALYFNDNKIVNLHMPSPTTQEFINKAAVVDEFKAYLRACAHENPEGKLLFINLQDRTSWREHARCAALEALAQNAEFEKVISVVTLAKDTDFYHQLPPYQNENHAALFINQFREQLEDESTGYYFPANVKKALFPHFIDRLLQEIHRVFFSSKNVLTRNQRMDFIELTHQFIELKLIEIVKPTAFCLSCKDGLDNGAASNAMFYAFFRLLKDEPITASEREEINLLLYGPSLVVRERIINADRFNRILNAIRTMESLKESLGSSHFIMLIKEAFGDLFKSSILKAQLLPPNKQG